MTRRSFLLALPATLSAARELRCDVAVMGGGLGGCAAALAALRNGMNVVITEETDWVGGQVNTQAVPPDEHPWIESFGCTGSYRAYRDGVRDYYRRHYPLTADAGSRAHLDPGDGSVSRLTHEPRVSLEVLESMLAPWVSGGRLTVLLYHRPVKADTSGDRVRAVTVKSTLSGQERTISAQYFIDATEQDTSPTSAISRRAPSPAMCLLINWPQNDYWLGNLHEVSDAEAARHLQRAKQLSLSLLYWMQTAAPRPDGKQGWRGLRLRRDVTGTEDGLAKYPYIRESRRIEAEFTVVEEHVGTEARMKTTGQPRDLVTAEPFADSELPHLCQETDYLALLR